MKALLTLFCILMICSCKDSTSGNQIDYTFTATVKTIGTDCNLRLITITSNQSKADSLFGNSVIADTYYAYNLPEHLQTEGLKIKFNARAVSKSELRVCTTLGPSYAALWIIEAEKAE